MRTPTLQQATDSVSPVNRIRRQANSQIATLYTARWIRGFECLKHSRLIPSARRTRALLVSTDALVVMRPSEARVVDEFLTAASEGTHALVLEGEAGIGKTTLWFEVVASARERGYRVLTAQAAVAESVLSYAALADLLRGLAEEWLDLPDVQKLALDRVLLRADTDSDAVDWRVLAAAFLALLERLTEQTPLLIALDDLQWLDASSIHVLAFAARRFPSKVSLVATVREERSTADPVAWLKLSRPDAIRRTTIQPMSLSGLHELISRRLDRRIPRPTMVRIHEISGGKPFFALELGRASDADSTLDDASLPHSVVDLVRSRIEGLRPQVRHILLAAACAGTATIQLVAEANGSDEKHALALVEDAESRGILAIDGNRLRFTHPILGRGVYNDATPAQRRAMHRRLAELVDEPELQARHLALGATSADDRTLQSLDAAAEMARTRGAPVAAAELLDLAIGLGGDTPERRIRSAQSHFGAGDPARAGQLLEEVVDRLSPGTVRGETLYLLALVRLYGDSYPDAARLLEQALVDADGSLRLRVQLLVALSYALMNCGESDRANETAELAVAEATRSQQPSLLSQAVGMQATLRFLRGNGLDEVSMRRALDLEDDSVPVLLAFRPDVQSTLLLAWTGALDEAASRLRAIRQHCIERGEEGELIFVAFHTVLIEVWRGNVGEAALVAEDIFERATQMGGDFPLFIALTTRAMVAAYAGRESQVRTDVADALEASLRCGSQRLAEWAVTTLGFLEVSLGNYQAALATLGPLRARIAGAPEQTEIIAAAFVPDAVEAMVALGLLDGAEELVAAMESNGRRVDRAWTLAVGARCRGMLCAARGDVDGALAAVQCAMNHHARIAMPFEAARTRLLLGEIQRRLRVKDASGENLREAMRTFEALNAPLWAERARASLARADVLRPQTDDGLSPSERRVAELVATGMTNRAIANALFISPKTVEANLARIYRKLNIPSRAALARYVSETPP